MPIDFSLLNDPAWQAKVHREQEARQEEQAARDKRLREAVNVCLSSEEELSEKERSLVRSCNLRINSFLIVTEPQEKWLCDIAERIRQKTVDAANDEGVNGPSLDN